MYVIYVFRLNSFFVSFLHFCDTTNGAVLDFVIAIHTINLSIAKLFPMKDIKMNIR